MKKNIIITGCSSGIGKMAAILLHKKNFNVIASYRSKTDVIDLEQQGIKCLHLDMRDTKSINGFYEKACEYFNHQIDCIFHNAAYGQVGAIEDLPIEALQEQFQVNFFAIHQLTLLILKNMRKYNSGRIVINSSVLGFVALKYRGAYVASKFALEGWADTLRLELSKTNIDVSIIEPGPISSKFRENALLYFYKYIKNFKNSNYFEDYQIQIERLESNKSSNKYTLPPEKVVDALLHALESKDPKIRYLITKPTKYIRILKRVLSDRKLDRLLKNYN
ncbi:short-chain dehydrogenase [Paraphotobacterium marinum]|uniref:Short-chain dehydrogenase n=1 Tax=Paraphotobacterium marinum TaxID=1755811 RepID=A0A220VC61_9GAMM|nr:SDR family NAD(P)-dependent oxidoreductase [Paraphotobacterium marinum]ASK77762.1 short-chain dehydrogenase [Paraphotobacterium marinum]